MSDEQQATQAESPWRAGVGWVAKHWPRVRLGHEGMMLESAQRGLRIREAAAKFAQTGDRSDMSSWPGQDGEDAMGVQIGDQIHYHGANQMGNQTTTSAPTQTTVTSGSSVLTSAIVAASMLMGGTGIGVVGAGLAGLLGDKNQQPPAVAAPADKPAVSPTKTDQYGIQLQHYVPGKK